MKLLLYEIRQTGKKNFKSYFEMLFQKAPLFFFAK
jgi:hypothetical protein